MRALVSVGLPDIYQFASQYSMACSGDFSVNSSKKIDVKTFHFSHSKNLLAAIRMFVAIMIPIVWALFVDYELIQNYRSASQLDPVICHLLPMIIFISKQAFQQVKLLQVLQLSSASSSMKEVWPISACCDCWMGSGR